MTNIGIRLTIVGLLVMAFFCGSSWAQQTAATTAQVEAKADKLLRSMCDLLGGAKSFSVHTTEAHDRFRNGKMVQLRGNREVILSRPDKLWMKLNYVSPQKVLEVWYDGATLTLESDLQKVYARTKTPPTLDEMLDYAGTTLDTPMPMADIFYSSPYDSYVTAETSGRYVKLDKIGQQSCHQLAFQSPTIDYRIWVDSGAKPVPCQIELVYKLDEGSPKSLMTFKDWNFAPQISASTFSHQPPADYQKIKIVGRVPVEEPAAGEPQTQDKQK